VPCLELLFCCLLHTHSLSLSLSFYLSLSHCIARQTCS
jgi:hypothetical protein